MIRHQHWRRAKLPPNVRLVARPTRWGNPYQIGRDGDRAECVARYRVWLAGKLRDDPAFLEPLRGAIGLACYCKPGELCHADVLLEVLAAA